MAKQSGRQKEIVGRVMHEYKHGELETKAGRKVRSRRQAVAIGLSEAGSSREKSPSQNRRARSRTETKERKGQTAQQQKEGRASERRTRAAATRSTARGRTRGNREEPTRAELYAETRRRGMTGCSRMSKAELQSALRRR